MERRATASIVLHTSCPALFPTSFLNQGQMPSQLLASTESCEGGIWHGTMQGSDGSVLVMSRALH